MKRVRRKKLIKRKLDTWGGVVATLVVVALIERGRVSGDPFPIPFLLLYASVALSANRGGLRAGLFSGIIASGFIIYAAQIPFGPPTLTGGTLEVSLGILIHMGSALLISLTTNQRDRYLRTLEGRTEQLESQVAARTHDLSEANRTLRQSEARFRALIEKSADAIVMFDASSKPVYASPSAATILGYTAEEISGLERLDNIHPDDRESARDRFRWLLEHPGEAIEAEARVQHRDGRWRVVQSISRNLLNDPVVSAIVTNFRDITERKHAEDTLRESERRFSRIFHNSPIATVLTRASDSVFVDVNDKMMDLTGFARDELVGRTSLELNLFLNPQARSRLTEKTRDGGDYRNIEMQLRTKSGEERYVSMSTVVIELNGEMHVISMAHDITDIKQTEDALRESEASLRSFYDSSNMHMGVIDLVDRNQVFVSNNRAHSEAFGLTSEQAVGKTSLDLGISPTTVEIWTEKYLESKQSNNQVHFEYKDSYQGKEFWYLGRVNYLGEASSGNSRFSFIAEDITERKQAEDTLRDSEERWRSLTEHSPDHVLTLDKELNITWVNRPAAGLTIEELIGKPLYAYVDAEYQVEVKTILETVLATGEPTTYETTYHTEEGNIFYESNVGVRVNEKEVIGLTLSVRDISERKHAEERNRYLAKLIEEVSDAIISTNSEFTIQSWNKAAETIYGWTAEEVLGKSVRTLLMTEYSHEDPEQVLEQFTDTGIWIGEVVQQCKDGTKISILSSVSMITDSAGKPSGTVAVNRDITKRKQAEDALRESQARLSAIARALPDLAFNVDENGTYIEVLSAQDHLLYAGSTQQMIGRRIQDTLPKVEADQILAAIRQTIETGDSQTIEYQLDVPAGRIQFETRTALIGDRISESPLVVMLPRDITERERLREEQQEKEKLQIELEAEKELNRFRSQFMSMISHDFRTPLTVIQTSSNMLQAYRDRLTPEKFNTRLDQIGGQVLRLTDMLDTVMLVIRGQSGRLEFNPVPADLLDFCERLVETMKGIAAQNQSLIFSAEGDIAAVLVDEELLRHILTNLISNAIKYSPDGGDIRVNVHRNAVNLIFQVSDQGIGIPLDDLPHLFQPYRRASNTGNIIGSGLGLSIVKLCAEAHKGSVEVSSQPGEGTTFTVSLPIA